MNVNHPHPNQTPRQPQGAAGSAGGQFTTKTPPASTDEPVPLSDSIPIECVRPDMIEPKPRSLRKHYRDEELDSLCTSIQEVGVQVPLEVLYPEPDSGRYVLIDGEKRLRCALILGLSEVPIKVVESPEQAEAPGLL